MWLRAFCALVAVGCFAAVRSEQVDVLITDTGSGVPIAGVTVSLVRNERPVVEAETDSKGRVTFSGLSASRYLLRVTKPGYVNLLDQNAHGREVIVPASNTTLEVGLSRIAVISGSVFDPEGRPLQGGRVFAVARRGTEDSLRLTTLGEGDYTDDLGRYRLHGLSPGHYSVAVMPSGGNRTIEAFAPTFYGSADLDKALFFELQPGEVRASVDILVARRELASISGKVFGIPPDVQPPRAAVALVTRGGLRFPMATVLTDGDGSFVILEVPPGDYQLIAWAPFTGWEPPWRAPKTNARMAARRVSVSGASVEVDLALSSPVNVNGRVVWELGGSRKSACSGLDEMVFRSDEDWLDDMRPEVVLEADRFSVTGLPAGRYTIEMPKLGSSCRLAEVRVDNQSTPHGVALLDGSAPLTLILTTATGDVSGSVATEKGSPAWGVVLLWPTDGDGAVQRAQIDAGGQYRFKDVLAGPYRLLALGRLDSSDYLDPQEARRLGAKSVLVEGGQKVTSDLRLVRR